MPDQLTLATQADGGFEAHRKSTRRDVFLARRIASAWGEPDFVQRSATRDRAKHESEWTYFLGSAELGSFGGGFAELTLYLFGGVVKKTAAYFQSSVRFQSEG